MSYCYGVCSRGAEHAGRFDATSTKAGIRRVEQLSRFVTARFTGAS
jgi:hypothetical protein